MRCVCTVISDPVHEIVLTKPISVFFALSFGSRGAPTPLETAPINVIPCPSPPLRPHGFVRIETECSERVSKF